MHRLGPGKSRPEVALRLPHLQKATPAIDRRYLWEGSVSQAPNHLHSYLEFCRKAKVHTATGGHVQLFWNSRLLDAAGWHREFVSALFRRIDDRAGIRPSGRKHTNEYQIGLMRDAQRLRDSHIRIRVFQFETPELRERFGHLLSSYND
jgi:hypothetical protein